VAKDDPKLIALAHEIGAKAALRSFVFQAHKGVQTVTMFVLKWGGLELEMIPASFFKALKDNDYKLTPEVRAQLGPQMRVLANLYSFMAQGKPLEEARPLKVERLVEREPLLLAKGDGTPAHPDIWGRDNFACLPFQLADGRYAIAYYLVTLNMVQDWNPSKELLDPARYQMPDRSYDLTLSNIRGKGAKLSVYDPLLGKELPVELLASSPSTLSVRLPCSDYPRFLVAQEAKAGPLVISPELKRTPKGAELSFSSNVEAKATVSWNRYPQRAPMPLSGEGGLLGEYFFDNALAQPFLCRYDSAIDFDWWLKPPAPLMHAASNSMRWTALLKPETLGKVKLTIKANDKVRLWLDGVLVIDAWTNSGSRELSGEFSFDSAAPASFKLEHAQGWPGSRLQLFWSTAKHGNQLVPPSAFSQQRRQASVGGGQLASFTLKPGERKILQLPLNDLDAVRISLESDGLRAVWPRWDYDVKGVIAPKASSFLASGVDASQKEASLKLPPLPAPAKKASKWRFPQDVLRASANNGSISLEAGKGEAGARTLDSLGSAFALLPLTAAMDSCQIKAISLRGFDAWRLDFSLEPAAHPGLAETRQSFVLLPLADGKVLFVSFAWNPFRKTDRELESALAAFEASLSKLELEQ
jgi:hypothetical protein